MRRRAISALAMPQGSEAAGTDRDAVRLWLTGPGLHFPIHEIDLTRADAAALRRALEDADRAFDLARELSSKQGEPA